MKNVILTFSLLLFVIHGFAQIEIKGYKIGGYSKSTSVRTTIMGETTSIDFELKESNPSEINSMDEFISSQVSSSIEEKIGKEIKSFRFDLSPENGIALMNALKNKYGGKSTKDYPSNSMHETYKKMNMQPSDWQMDEYNAEKPEQIILVSGNTQITARFEVDFFDKTKFSNGLLSGATIYVKSLQSTNYNDF